MILPGISGSFLLGIMDKYAYLLELISGVSSGAKEMIAALAHGDMQAFQSAWSALILLPVIVFNLGTIIGLVSFSRVLNWLFSKFKELTIAILVGFLIGSLFKIWPWKRVLEYYQDSHGRNKPLIEENILPPSYDSYFALCLALVVGGFLVVYLIELFSDSKKKI